VYLAMRVSGGGKWEKRLFSKKNEIRKYTNTRPEGQESGSQKMEGEKNWRKRASDVVRGGERNIFKFQQNYVICGRKKRKGQKS